MVISLKSVSNEVSKPDSKNKAISKPVAKHKNDYVCTACNWKFSRAEPLVNCPYCGKEKVIANKNSGAEELLQEIRDAEQCFESRN